MTNADMIRQMSNDELIELLVWGELWHILRFTRLRRRM